ncbi:hypothetical protein BaRGS_00013628 [Batillaria attramentaria]|uniref:Uncharacterized protein n=1 Tax=Batillaria attramentaria TaxID=370345 RepID=A0ABD0L6W7_9CAEN
MGALSDVTTDPTGGGGLEWAADDEWSLATSAKALADPGIAGRVYSQCPRAARAKGCAAVDSVTSHASGGFGGVYVKDSQSS